MMMSNIIFTSTAEHFSPHFARRGGFRVVPLGKNKDGKNVFPDGEVYARLLNVGEMTGRTIVVHAGAPRPNDGVVELDMVLAVLRRAGIKDVEVFFTYIPYGMQDRVFEEGETNAAEDLLRKLIDYWGVKRVYAIDPHFDGGAMWLRGIPFTAVSAHELLVSEARKNYPDAVFVAPDLGHERRTKALKGFRKTRADSYTVTIEHDEVFMKGLARKAVGVVDDLIETGGTMAHFFDECRTYGAREIFAVATHGVLPSGIARVTAKYSKLFLGNTIDQPEANVDLSPLIIEALK